MKLESQPAANTLLYIATIVIGLALMFLARDFSHGGTNVLAGFFLGCMLFVLGLLGMLIGETRTVELDERRKRIVLSITRRVGGCRQVVIPFSEVRNMGIGMQGKVTSGSRFYDLVLTTTNGKEIYLFGGCVFEGRMSREWVESLKKRFEKAVGDGI
jgi:zinc transporter ZupT